MVIKFKIKKSILPYLRNCMISICHCKFQSQVRYGIIFWGADNESVPIFKLQMRVIGMIYGVGTGNLVDNYLRIIRYYSEFSICT